MRGSRDQESHREADDESREGEESRQGAGETKRAGRVEEGQGRGEEGEGESRSARNGAAASSTLTSPRWNNQWLSCNLTPARRDFDTCQER